MKIQTARDIGKRIADLLEEGKQDQALQTLEPCLKQKIPFTHTGEMGLIIGQNVTQPIKSFLRQIADTGAMGGWPVIGMTLQTHIVKNTPDTLNTCREFIILGDTWYSTDILGERVPGPALVSDFDQTLPQLIKWCDDSNRWVRRVIGVAVHLWCKRTKSDPKLKPRAEQLLELLHPLFGEREMDAVKGIGWGIKSMGKIYPDLVTDWLIHTIHPTTEYYRATMLNKSVEKLPVDLKSRVLETFRR